MNKRDRNIILAILCWVTSAVIFIVALFQLPSFFTERSRLQGLQAKLSNQLEIEARLKTFRESFAGEADKVKSELARRQQLVTNASFTCLPSSQISTFVDDLQKLFAAPGVSLEKLAYKTREVKGELVILPFEANLLCSYSGMRSLLHGLETHPAGIRIEQLEFSQLDFKGMGASLRLGGMVRFKKIGD